MTHNPSYEELQRRLQELEEEMLTHTQAGEALSESENLYRLLADKATDVIWTVDMGMRLTFVSPSVTRLLGFTVEEAMARTMQQAYTPAAFEKAMQIFAEEMAIEITGHGDPTRSRLLELELVHKDGNTVPVEGNFRFLRDPTGKAIGILSMVRDITERKRVEEERLQLTLRLQQVQKAESLGRMAGAIAHHFNNLLGAVIGNLELVMYQLPHESRSHTYIAQAMKASNRAAEISRFMLTYLGQAIVKKEPLDLTKAVGEAQALHHASMPANIHLKSEFPSQGPIIHADGVHIKQILTDLVFNAMEAVGEAEGHIEVAVEAVTAEKIRESKFLPIDWNPKEKSYACLSVSDTGPGLDLATIDRIFDPFFTTKFTGRGLGLSVVLGLMRAYEGAIAVESRPGEGAVFRVYFPILEQ